MLDIIKYSTIVNVEKTEFYNSVSKIPKQILNQAFAELDSVFIMKANEDWLETLSVTLSAVV